MYSGISSIAGEEDVKRLTGVWYLKVDSYYLPRLETRVKYGATWNQTSTANNGDWELIVRE